MKLFTALLQTIVLISTANWADAQSPTSSPRSTPVGVGAIAPDFTLEDQNRNKINLADARSKGPVVLVFYRGYW